MTFYIFLGLVFSVAIWGSSAVQDAFYGLYGAGRLQRMSFVKVAVPAVLLTALAIAFAPNSYPIPVDFALLVSMASLANVMYVVVMAGVYGVSLPLADAAWWHYQLDQTAKPHEPMTDPVKLQAYLDRVYGKGLVNAHAVLAEKAARTA